MKKLGSIVSLVALSVLAGANVAFAADGEVSGYKYLGAGLAVGLAAIGGTLGQGKVASAALDSIGRNPSASGKMNTPLFVGLALIESLVILAWLIANNTFAN